MGRVLLSFALLFCLASSPSASRAQEVEDLGPEEWNPEPWPFQAASTTDDKLCLPLERFGCWFAPATIRHSNAPTLIVFFRGWRDDRERSNIPPGERVVSAR